MKILITLLITAGLSLICGLLFGYFIPRPRRLDSTPIPDTTFRAPPACADNKSPCKVCDP